MQEIGQSFFIKFSVGNVSLVKYNMQLLLIHASMPTFRILKDKCLSKLIFEKIWQLAL